MAATVFQGMPVFTSFRAEGLLKAVREGCPDLGVERVEADFVYFVESSDTATAIADAVVPRICALLGASGPFAPRGGFFVTPRKGTISPWSSKATDIFHNCGLDCVRRVERGVHYRVLCANGRVVTGASVGDPALRPFFLLLHDRMTEGVYDDVSDLFAHMRPAPLAAIPLLEEGPAALERANRALGLALSDGEIRYLHEAYRSIRRNPTDVELVMFGQANSEHCRHKIFNADWVVDGAPQPRSLFGMIRHTHERHPSGVLVAYRDNSAVVEGSDGDWFESCPDRGAYAFARCPVDLIMKVETHNHPTAICPYPGAATGVGGEIRDEAATGVGGRSKAGLCGFMVSDLRVPGFAMPWEKEYAVFPGRLATPLRIMLEGPIGGARFGNEFGRPQLCGLFRTFEQVYNGRHRGYHKPIMVAGGMGNIKRAHARKRDLAAGSLIVQIGGPAMRIGLGGGAASSMATGSNAEGLDFDSVQRDNAEMQRRCQGVIDACIAMGAGNPILSIHDIGAGGLSNGCPELVAETGGAFRLRAIHNEDSSMSPMEIWCCEAQERYVLAIAPESLDRFLNLCRRERCEVAVIGRATGDGRLELEDEHFGNRPIDIDLGVILGKPPRMRRVADRVREEHAPLQFDGVSVRDAAERVLRLPAVANKTFLISIADRSVTGLVARDQMVGPYQTPISDVAVTATSFTTVWGEAMAMGERTNLALISAPASGRMAIGEALTNIAAACVGPIGNVKLSANWMCACGEPGEDANLFDTVRAVGMELCPALGVAIPVGKDSLSMRTLWTSPDGRAQRVVSPLSLVVSAFAPVRDVRKTVTPDLKPGDSVLLLVDLGRERNRLGGSALAQVYNQVGDPCPDLDDPDRFVRFFGAVQELVEREWLLAYHDRSDGGLFVTVAEMAFGGRRGVRLEIDAPDADPLPALFSEELGAVLQVTRDRADAVRSVLGRYGLDDVTRRIGAPADDRRVEIHCVSDPGGKGATVFAEKLTTLNRQWSELTWRMQALRDNPACAVEEYDNLLDESDPGIRVRLTFDPERAPSVTAGRRPRMAILREQGVNGHVEMAAAFDRAGFESVDVHMTDLIAGRADLAGFSGLVACGGFSYGDVLGAGAGWARSILFSDRLRDMFAEFFRRPETFALGVCNGCQMFSLLKEAIPGAEHWPAFTRNRSEQFEARFVSVAVERSPSVLLRGMAGSVLSIPVAHGEGLADFAQSGSRERVETDGLVALRYVDNHGLPTGRYPFNPNGSPGGITGLTTTDGRVTIMMPHPERAFRSVQLSYRPSGAFGGESGPWLRMFRNAREFVG
jgi:phosphoribosylformylglycinamidine synthase